MELITELMNDPKNTNRNYTHKIKESKYVQSSSQMDDSYSTINELFLSLYDPSFSLLPSKEKTFYMKQKLLQIATDIDEKSREKYECFNYNNKFTKSMIQRGLQLSEYLSTVLYLNDLYGIRTILVFKDEKCYYETTPKTKEKVYLRFTQSNEKWSLGTEGDIDGCSQKNLSELNSILINDVLVDSIYKNYLKPISSYKASELQEIASSDSISLVMDGKKKTKKMLYDEINLYHLNLI